MIKYGYGGNMKGIIAIPENRDTINKMKNFKFKSISEEQFDNKIDVIKNIVKIAGVVATVVLVVVPVDGPFGELATALATPVLVKAVESMREPLKSLVVKKENRINAAIIDENGNNKPITLVDNDMAQNINSNNNTRMM